MGTTAGEVEFRIGRKSARNKYLQQRFLAVVLVKPLNFHLTSSFVVQKLEYCVRVRIKCVMKWDFSLMSKILQRCTVHVREMLCALSLVSLMTSRESFRFPIIFHSIVFVWHCFSLMSVERNIYWTVQRCQTSPIEKVK